MNVVVALGTGNIGSVVSALEHLGAEHLVSADADVVAGAGRIILPGVGAFDAGMAELEGLGLAGPITRAVRAHGTPVLGVCLGMQLLLEGSDEGRRPGLGLVPGRATRLGSSGAKVPHVGFSEVVFPSEGLLGRGLSEANALYFTHSYALRRPVPGATNAMCRYDDKFVAAVEAGPVHGVQFHPEKSQATGLRVLANFLTGTGAR